MIRGLTDVIVGARAEGPWRALARHLGFEIVAHGVDRGHLGQGREARVLASPGVETGRFRIILTPEAPQRERPRGTELGLFDVDLYTRDIDALYRATRHSGLAWLSEPGSWTLPGTPVRLTQGLILGPDGVNIVPVLGGGHATWLKAWQLEPERLVSEISSALCIVRDLDASSRFWAGAFGMESTGSFTLQNPFLDRLLSLPTGTHFRMGVMASPGATARVELIEMPHGIDRTNEGQPGAAGIIAWGFRTDSLDAALARLAHAGGKIEHAVVDVDDAIHGRARVATARSYDNTLIELWEPR